MSDNTPSAPNPIQAGLEREAAAADQQLREVYAVERPDLRPFAALSNQLDEADSEHEQKLSAEGEQRLTEADRRQQLNDQLRELTAGSRYELTTDNILLSKG